MNHLLQQLAGSGWTQVVNALLHTLWQGAILSVALGIAFRRLTAPTLRYRCGLAALVAIFAGGLLTWAVLNSSDVKPTAAIASNNLISKPVEVGQLGEPETVVVVRGTKVETVKPPRWTAWLALVWLTGAGAMLARAGAQVAGAGWLRRSCRPLEDSRVAALAAEAQRAVKLTRQVRIAVTDKLTSPAVVGVLVPTLILPLSLVTTLTPEQLRFILLHELAHIRRGDYLANLFQLFAEALLFFNPAVWWISHQIRREREACCDALAIDLSGAPADYARTLVHVAESILTPPPVAAPAFGDRQHEPSSLADRVQRLLVPGYRPALRLTWRAMLTALLLGSALLVLSAMGTRVTVAQIITTPKQPAKPSGSAANNIGNTNRPPFEITAGESAFDASTGIGTYSNNVVIKDVFLKGTNFTMRADSATMNTKTGELNANGHVVIQRGEDTIRGSSIRYNFKTGAMEVKSVGALTRTSAGRQAIMAKLNRIRLASVSFDAQPLSEVVRQLSQQIRLNDPQSNGINLLINFPSDVGIAPSSPQIDPATGLPVSNTVAPAFAPESVLITILPPMTNARVADVLEAVVNGANKPIKYALLDYGIAFSPKGPETPALHTRTFRVDTGKFISALGVPAGVTNSGRWQAAILNFFSKAGADLGPESGKNVFFSDGSGALLVRATAKELTSIEQFLVLHELMTVNPATNSPSINFASKTVVPIPKVAVADKSRSGELIVRGMEEENAFTNWNSEATQKAGTNSTNLLTREFVLDVNTFVLNLEKSGAFGANSTAPKTDRESVQAALLHYFTKGGVDLSPEAGKSLFYNNRNGRLLVRTTPSDLDSVEGLVHSLNYAPPQINIKVKFVTVPNKGFDEFLGALGITNQIGNSSTQQVTGILTPTQFRSVLSTLEKRPGTSLLSEGQVTTLIGRQAQIQSVDLKHYVIGKTNGVPETMEIPTGQILDVVSFTNSYADGDSVQLRATSSLVEFLGYDDPGKFAIAGSDGKTTTNPIPRFRERQMNADAVLWDGQTLVLAGAPASNVQLVKDKSPLLGDIPFLGKMFRKEHATTQTNQVIVFVTATIIDSAGNRVHPDKDPK